MTVVNNILKRLAGEISRIVEGMFIEPFRNSESSAAIPFGYVIAKDATAPGAGKLPAASTNVIFGVCVREIRQGGITGAADVEAGKMGSLMRKGYITMKCVNGTPTVGGNVFFRYALGETGSATRAIGTIETAAITNEVIQLNGATFESLIDGDGLVDVLLS